MKFSDVCVPKDRNVAFTVMPMMDEGVSPPQVMWSSLGIVSPPPVDKVLGHLRGLTKDGGFLDCWDFKEDGREAVFSDVFKCLDENWGKLSPNVQAGLRDNAIVPMGSCLVKAKSIFFRLPMNLAPLMHELPRWCVGNSGFMEKIGVREKANVEDYVACLGEMKKDVGGEVMNPNELVAVLRLSKFLSHTLSEQGGEIGTAHVVYGVDDGGRLCDLKNLFYNDAPWLTGRVDRGLVRFAHPRYEAGVCEDLNMRKLGASVVEVLDVNCEVEEVEEARRGSEELREVLRSEGFWVVVEGMVEGGGGAREKGRRLLRELDGERADERSELMSEAS